MPIWLLIDDCFKHAEGAQAGRQQAEILVRQMLPRDEVLGSLSDALHWIAERCELASDDRHFLCRHLAPMAHPVITEAAKRYLATWRAAADEEPQTHRCDNGGRFTANSELRGWADDE